MTDVKADATLRLPAELWLQILEQVDDVEFLWCTVRSLSHTHKSLVDRVFISSVLPTISMSLSLPRFDPQNGQLRYPGMVPGGEITFHCQSSDAESSRITLVTPTKFPKGETVEQLTTAGTLAEKRLNGSTTWMWFGSQRGKGASVVVDKDMQWEGEKKVWIWKTEWESLVHEYFRAKRALRHAQRPTGKDGRVDWYRLHLSRKQA